MPCGFHANKSVPWLTQATSVEEAVLQCGPGWTAVPTAKIMWPSLSDPTSITRAVI